jgi:uncharacterized protein (DUF362 family)
MERRRFLQLLAADVAAGARNEARGASSYWVGVGASSSPYIATQRAIAASGQFPAVAGQTVVIKPNLVSTQPAASGATTDVEVVRAIVDVALDAGAAQVLIVEGGAGRKPANFEPCGYSFFASYDPRVRLYDFGANPYVLATVSGGYAYQRLHVPSLVVQPGIVFISAGKLKTHVNAVVSLSMKNLFGLAMPSAYEIPGKILARQDLHYRGVDLSTIDLNMVRPIRYAVIDGIVGMQGQGPIQGTPVIMNLAFAGLNPVATDRVAVSSMEIAQTAVPHLAYAAVRGLGPQDLGNVTILGDSITPYQFIPAITPPVLWRPLPNPNRISLQASQQSTIVYNIPQSCLTRAEIIRDDDASPGITVVRTLHDWTLRPAGNQYLNWRGENDSSGLVAPGNYLVRIAATYNTQNPNYAVGRITVIA